MKKKGKSKRVTLKDKYKMQKRVVETNRKRRKASKEQDGKSSNKMKGKSKDPGIPNSWPFKQDLLKEIQRTRELQQQSKEKQKEQRKSELEALREHQANGGSARSVAELMEQAKKDRDSFDEKQQQEQQQDQQHQNLSQENGKDRKKDNLVEPGQASRRAYLKELKKVVDAADVLLQVLDARDPIGSRVSPAMENMILSRSDKKMVLVLNKIDLVPKDVVGQWLTILRRSHPAIAVKASRDFTSNNDDIDDISNTPVGMEGLLQLLKNYARTSDAKSKTTIVVGIIGYPNTGKSSIINALKRTRAVGVSPRPGFTTSMQEVFLDKNVRLLDSPGVVFDDKSAMLGNCVDAESIEDPIPAVEQLILRCNPASLVMTYNIPAFPPGNVMMFLAMVARSYGRVLKGGIPDKVGAARAVLKDWNSGKIPYFTPAPLTKLVAEDAVIVKTFGTEFDVSKYDNQVLNSLKETDEMDFVQLEDDKVRPESVDAEFCEDDDDDDDGEECSDDGDHDMEEDDMDEDEMDEPCHISRNELETAEDYDFEES